MNMNYLITFRSISFALMAKNKLIAKEYSCDVVPVPRTISSSCGYAIEIVDATSSAELKDTLLNADIEFGAIFRFEGSGRQFIYEKIDTFPY